MIKREIIIGIYKITSLSGGIYIGYSKGIYERWGDYKCLDCKKQTYLYNLLLKHGAENHTFEIVHIIEKGELTKQEITKELKRLEKHYIGLFNSFVGDNEHGMNLTRGGEGGEFSEISVKRLSESLKLAWVKRRAEGKGRVREDVKKRISEVLKDKYKDTKQTNEFKKWKKTLKKLFKNINNRPPMINKCYNIITIKKITENGYIFRKRLTEKEKEHLRQINSGKIMSPESIAKAQTTKNNRTKEEKEKERLKRSIANSKENNPMWGKTQSVYTISKRTETINNKTQEEKDASIAKQIETNNNKSKAEKDLSITKMLETNKNKSQEEKDEYKIKLSKGIKLSWEKRRKEGKTNQNPDSVAKFKATLEIKKQEKLIAKLEQEMMFEETIRQEKELMELGQNIEWNEYELI